jgi:DNA invertase Pin-like site-specific DNA recombinase
MKKRVAIYLRVSTSKQDTDNQLRELTAVADRSGWEIWKVYEDAGISGAKGRDQRPGLDAMMKAVNAKEFDMVATWSVDRLGRSLTDLLGILQGLHEMGVGLFLHRQGLDSSTTAGKGSEPNNPAVRVFQGPTRSVPPNAGASSLPGSHSSQRGGDQEGDRLDG